MRPSESLTVTGNGSILVNDGKTDALQISNCTLYTYLCIVIFGILIYKSKVTFTNTQKKLSKNSF